jgi:post-segregation antitoxin (ccd killing protein)
MNDTVSVRIPREIKEKLKEFNINVSEVIRTCLQDTVRREGYCSRTDTGGPRP